MRVYARIYKESYKSFGMEISIPELRNVEGYSWFQETFWLGKMLGKEVCGGIIEDVKLVSLDRENMICIGEFKGIHNYDLIDKIKEFIVENLKREARKQ